MLVPLKEFICDTCGQVIEDPSKGYLCWSRDILGQGVDGKNYDFKIVHHLPASPLKDVLEKGCYPHRGTPSYPMRDIMRPTGYNWLLSLLDRGKVFDPIYPGPNVRDIRDVVEIIKRTTIPYYEEARQDFEAATKDGFFKELNDMAAFGEGVLQTLISEYGEGT